MKPESVAACAAVWFGFNSAHFKIPNLYSTIINHCTEIVAVLMCMTAITSMRRVGVSRLCGGCSELYEKVRQ